MYNFMYDYYNIPYIYNNHNSLLSLKFYLKNTLKTFNVFKFYHFYIGLSKYIQTDKLKS